MGAVIETLAKYETYLKYDRQNKPETIRKVNLSLSYFTELYGLTDTKDLKASDMHIFYEWLKNQQCKRNVDGTSRHFGSAYLQKIMTHLKAYVKWLSDSAMLSKLVAADVPRWKVIEKMPAHLTKDEMALLMKRLELDVIKANMSGKREEIYATYLRRAVVRMLYTAGLRNSELRSLTYSDINIPYLCGTVLWKGDKYGVYTFSLGAKEKLVEYLALRDSYFPETKFKYLFTLYEKGEATPLTEQKLNQEIKEIAKNAGIKQNVHAHLFRHTLATHLLEDWWSIVDVKEKLRHSNIAVTSIYVHSNPEVVKTKTQSLGSDLLSYQRFALTEEEHTLSVMHSLLLHLLSNTAVHVSEATYPSLQ